MMIRSAEELHKLLTKAWEVETQYETLAHWEGYIAASSDEFRATIFGLISESQKHEGLVKELLDSVILPKSYKAEPLQRKSFDFQGHSEFDVMTELGGYEHLAFDLYSRIKQAVKMSDVDGWIPREKQRRFMEILDQLIADESEHAQIVDSHVGRVKKIR